MADDKKARFPGFTGEMYPEVFDIRAMPPQPEVKKPGQLPDESIKQFFTKGYLVVENFFEPYELDPIKETICRYVDNVARSLYKAGQISSLYEDHGYKDRLVKLEAEFPGANILCFKQMAVVPKTKLEAEFQRANILCFKQVVVMPKALKDIWTDERLLNLIEQLIGPDIAGNPVWNIRTKTPRNDATTVPWHQDASYSDLESYKTLVPTAWIPFLDTDEKNGCLQFIEGGHKMGMVVPHTCCFSNTWYTMMQEADMEKSAKVTRGVNVKEQIRNVPIKYGGLVLFNNMIPHRSLDNLSDHVRWSVDLRWQRTQDPPGLFSLKDGVVFRSSTEPDLKIDWGKFDGVNRNSVQMGDKVVTATKNPMEEVPEITDFDTHVFGPWMGKWELVNINRHVQMFLDTEKTKN